MIKLLDEKAAGRKIEKVAFLHVTCLEDAKKFETLLRKHMDIPEEVLYCSLESSIILKSIVMLISLDY